MVRIYRLKTDQRFQHCQLYLLYKVGDGILRSQKTEESFSIRASNKKKQPNQESQYFFSFPLSNIIRLLPYPKVLTTKKKKKVIIPNRLIPNQLVRKQLTILSKAIYFFYQNFQALFNHANYFQLFFKLKIKLHKE